MFIKNTFHATCLGCHAPMVLREYNGFEGGQYSDHFCLAAERLPLPENRVPPTDLVLASPTAPESRPAVRSFFLDVLLKLMTH